MAVLSLSRWTLSLSSQHKPTCSHIKISNKKFPRLGRTRFSNQIISKSLTSVEGLSRRTGNHHPNLWDDDFIQSLPKHPYQDPYYCKRAEKLVGEIKEMFNAMTAPEIGKFWVDNVCERLVMVDNVERLGIDKHFEKEIREALDYVYRYWNECSLDLNTTALGLRILRLHRYPVSSDVLEHFKRKDGQFLCSTTQSEQEKIRSILNLFRASLIDFPHEKVMDEAKTFATTYLNQAILKNDISSNLSQEITFNLEYGWRTNLPRIEARNYMSIYGENSSWLKTKDNKKLLYLAKLDFNIMQSFHRQELQILSRWWRESGLCKLSFSRHRHVEYQFLGCAVSAEPKYYAFRIALAKFSALATYFDDIYDTYGTFEELKLFTEAIKRWDPNPADYLPEYMKIAYRALYEAMNESGGEADKSQGRDTRDYARKAWEFYIDSIMQEAEWIATGYIPNFKEYLENGKVTSGARSTTLNAILTLDALLPENILRKIDYPSRFDEILGLTLRLRGDTITFKAEADRGEVASSITCYMRDHPESNEDDALNYLKYLLNELLKELNWEYLKPNDVPTCIKDHAYNISRGFHIFYKERDGFSISNKDIKNHVTQILIEPIEM